MKEKPGTTTFGDLCYCSCHQVGRVEMHCVPCCDRCEEKYLGENGDLLESAESPLKLIPDPVCPMHGTRYMVLGGYCGLCDDRHHRQQEKEKGRTDENPAE